MQIIELREYVLNKLIECNKKNRTKFDTAAINYTAQLSECQYDLEKLKASTNILKILVYPLLIMSIIVSSIKILGESSWPDLNKGALFILLTASNALCLLIQNNKIAKLDKEILLLDNLEKIDRENLALKV